MAATIKIKNSSTAGAAPTSSDLVQGELAVNVTDKRLYTENASGTVVELGTNPSVPVTFPDGSASAPSLTNDGDTNTGLFFPAADTVGIATGGSERARVDSSGNLGLGVTPSAWGTYNGVLDLKGNGSLAAYNQAIALAANAYYNGSNWIYKSTTTAGFFQAAGNAFQWYQAPSGTAGNAVTFTQAMTLDSSGSLLVGVTSALSGSVTGIQADGSDWATTFRTTNASNGGLCSWMQRTASTGEFIAFRYGSGTGSGVGAISTNGTTTTYSTSSDYRLKNVTGSLTGYKERLSALQPKQGSWKADGSEFRGFLAHEFAVSYPTSVNGEKDAVDADGNPQYQGMQAGSSEVIADLVAYIKELETRLTALEQA